MISLMFRSKYTSTDVVCVKFFGSFVLAGVGGILKVFSLSNKCVLEQTIFKDHKIYGIEPYLERYVLIHGSKEAHVYSFASEHSPVSLSCIASVDLDDWILTAHWLSNGTQVALITAHNVAWLWPKLDMSGSTSSLKRALCSEKCILYSATVAGENWSECVVFAGTVFREVVVWLPAGTTEYDQPVLHRLLGHNGVIFSLAWDWQKSLLCSTSDDRTVRLWQVDLPDKNNWEASSVVCSHVLYGHSARVWRSVIVQDIVVSVGEDCKICVWNESGKLIQTIDRTTCGCQWSVDCSAERQLLVAGAGDGSVQLIPFSYPLSRPTAQCIPYTENILQQNNLESIRKLIFLATSYVVAVTEDGSVLHGSAKTPASWRVLWKDDRFSNYCVLSVAPDRERFSLASLKGLILLNQGIPSEAGHWTVEQQVEDGKIWSVLWLSREKVLVCGDEGRLTVWQISETAGIHLTCIGRLKLPRARERWPTSAIIVCKEGNDFLLCGDRCGSLHLYRLQTKEYNEFLDPNHSLPKLHGKLGVTSIHQFGCKLLSTGRDGNVRAIGIDSGLSQLSALSSDKMMMDWVCTVLPYLFNFLIVGFKETNMIVWSSKERRTILQLDCGGGHRSWDCTLTNKGEIQISFIKEKHIYFSSVPLDSLMKPTLQQGISPRELNCVSAHSNIPSTFMFGGEDGTVYVCQFDDAFEKLERRITLTSHISSVRCMCLHEGLVFSAGGRAQLKAWKIENSGEDLSCIELGSHMLKGERGRNSPPSIDPEMRYMSICGIPCDLNNSTVQLVVGCSDGVVRWLVFNSVSRKFQVADESFFHKKCILKVCSIRMNQGNTILISTATDGQIALWEIFGGVFSTPGTVKEPFWSSQIHQSGVNSISTMVLPSSESTVLLVASGGDDNAVTLNALQLKQRDVFEIAKWSCSSAHAAQVTGVWLVGKLLLSTSIDQRLTVWNWNLIQGKPAQLSCNFLSQTICFVPDIQDMQVIEEENFLQVCVVGKGMQIVSLPYKEEDTSIVN